MEYNIIQYKPAPNEETDTLFKRIILKLCQLYPFHKEEISLITKQLQDYRDLLKSKDFSTINFDNVNNSLKKFDDKLTQFYNNESIARQIYLKQLKLMYKLLKEDFNEDDFKNLPFQKLYLVNKEKYELLNDELKDIFFNYYTSNKKVKPIMQMLKLWYSLKEKKLRNIIKSELNQFRSELNASAFKSVKKDTREYITKTNEELAKSIRGEVKQIVEGGPLDKLRFLTSQQFDITGKEGKISNELLSNLKKFNLLKDKYKPLISQYEQAREDDKFNVRREIENALYDLKPIYEICKDGMNLVNDKIKKEDKKFEIIKLIERIDILKPDELNKLYQDFAKYSSLFLDTDKEKYNKIINDKYDLVFKSNVEDIIEKDLRNLFSSFKSTTKRPMFDKDKKLTGHFINEWKTKLNKSLNKFNLHEGDDLYDKMYAKYLDKDIIYRVWLNYDEEKRKKIAEEEAKKLTDEEVKKLTEEEENKKFQEENNELDEQKDEIMEEKTQAEGCNIFDLQNKTLTQILKEINDKYNKLPNQKLDGVIYINLKKRFPNKDDFNKFFIQQLKKFDKKYNYEKYKQYMSEKKYSKKYIDELNKGGFLGPLINGVISIGKKIFGLNDDAIKASGPLSSLLSMIGLNDKVLKDKNIRAGGIFSKFLNFIGLSDDIFEKDELLNKIKPFIDLFKKEKNNKMIDSYLYAIVKLELDDDEDEDKIKEVYNNLLFKYDELYRPKLHKQRLDKNYYDVKAGFPFLALAPLIPTALNSISNLINSIRGKGCNEINKKEKVKKSSSSVCGGKIISLSELQELKNKIN